MENMRLTYEKLHFSIILHLQVECRDTIKNHKDSELEGEESEYNMVPCLYSIFIVLSCNMPFLKRY